MNNDIDNIDLYYVQNEKQYKKLLIGLINKKEICQDEFYNIGINGCDLYENEENECYNCEKEYCRLWENIDNKNIIEKFYVNDELEFPLILVYDYSKRNDSVHLISINDLKNNTKELI